MGQACCHSLGIFNFQIFQLSFNKYFGLLAREQVENCRHIHLKGDKSGCVEEVNNEGKIEIDRPNECPQDDQHPEKPGFFYIEIYNFGKMMR